MCPEDMYDSVPGLDVYTMYLLTAFTLLLNIHDSLTLTALPIRFLNSALYLDGRTDAEFIGRVYNRIQ